MYMNYNKPVQRKIVKAYADDIYSSKNIIETNAAGQELSIVRYWAPPRDQSPHYIYEFSYLPNGLLATKRIISTDLSDREETILRYSYDAQNRECRVDETTTSKNGIRQSTTTYEYKNGKKFLGKRSHTSGETEHLDKVLHYDENGWLVQSDCYLGKFLEHIIYHKNDAEGRPLEETMQYTKEYLDDPFIRKTHPELRSDVTFLLTKKEYDEAGHEIASYLYQDCGQSITHESHHRYNEKGEVIFSRDTWGDKTLEYVYRYETTIADISNGEGHRPASFVPAESEDNYQFDPLIDEKFRPLFQKACRNDPDALWEIIVRYENADEFPYSSSWQFYWLKRATQSLPQTEENARFWNDLAFCFHYGKGTEKDIPAAIEAYKLALKLGNTEARTNLGIVYYYETTGETRKNALAYLEEAYQQHDLIAQDILGIIYLEGEIVKKDTTKGVHLLEAAVNEGYADAAFTLALAYDEDGLLPESLEKSYYYYAKAADLGDTHYACRCAAGLAYAHAQSVPRNFDKSRKYLTPLPIDYDNHANFLLGSYCFEGLGGPIDREEGERRLRQAMTDEDILLASEAKNSLALYFYQADERLPEAISLLKSAAADGNANAIGNLGKAYFEGKGVPQSNDMAIRYWKQAAELGSQDAVSNLQVIGSAGNMFDLSDDTSTSQEAPRGGGCLAVIGKAILGFFFFLVILAIVVNVIALLL